MKGLIMTRRDLMLEILGLFCPTEQRFDFTVDRVNDLSEEEWLSFQVYVKNYTKYSWLSALTLMEIIDMACDNWEKGK
jgi:hypothetical protein